MGFRGSECVVSGDVRADVPRLIETHGYQIRTTATASSAGLTSILANYRRSIIVAYYKKGWTHIFDPLMTLATDEPLWEEFTQGHAVRAFGWLTESTSNTLAFWDYKGGTLLRKILVVDGELTESGERIVEEADVAWESASPEDLLQMLERFGPSYDGMATEVEYQVFDVVDA